MGIGETIYVLSALFVFALVGVCFYYDYKLKTPPVPTLPRVKNAILAALDLYAPQRDLSIAELGCGWGGLLLAIHRVRKHASITGFELSPFPYAFSAMRTLTRRHIKVERCDLFTQDLSGYDVVIYYLVPVLAAQLEKKFDAELKSGALVISNGFPLPSWEPIEVRKTKGLITIPVYVYRKT